MQGFGIFRAAVFVRGTAEKTQAADLLQKVFESDVNVSRVDLPRGIKISEKKGGHNKTLERYTGARRMVE